MYRHCIYCSADLRTNEALEAFPIGRTVAFDAEKGRLWAVCGSCARWNLSPFEERWEPVEQAERAFRDTRLRVQSENVGLARLPDGTRLIRVGEALPGEMAAWRYGRALRSRRFTSVMRTIGRVVLLDIGLVSWLSDAHNQRNRVLHRIVEDDGSETRVLGRHLLGARVADGADGIRLTVPGSVRLHAEGGRTRMQEGPEQALVGSAADRVLSMAMVDVNTFGASARALDAALATLDDAGSAAALVRSSAGDLVLRSRLGRLESGWRDPSGHWTAAAQPRQLALEMALHEEQERAALQGELDVLEAAWREAEEIAGIADRLAISPGNDD